MIIQSPEAMHEFGKQTAKNHKIVLLQGDLGSGKTTFTKGFAEGLGIDINKVQSPTYTYLNIYDNKLLHIDMRRIESYEELVQKGIIEHINEFDYIIIERPKYINQIGLKNTYAIEIKKTSPTTREILFT